MTLQKLKASAIAWGKKGPVLQRYLLAVLLGFLYFFIWNLMFWVLVF